MKSLKKLILQNVKRSRLAPFYKKKLCQYRCDSMADFHALPFSSKEDLREAYPYGGLAIPINQILEAHTSSASTGSPVISFFSKKDLEESSKAIAEAWRAFGVTKDTKLMFAMSYGLFSGAPLNTYALQYIGAFVLPVGIVSMSKYYDFIDQFGIDFVVATPGFFYYLNEYCNEKGVNPKETSLRQAVVAGEPYSDKTKIEISEMFNIEVFDHYGLAEVNTGILYECKQSGMMHPLESYIYLEVVNEKGEQVESGEVGELVFTSLKKQASPVIRYKTGDLVKYFGEISCSCGKKGRACGRILSRNDSVVSIKGVKINPYELRDQVMQKLSTSLNPESCFTLVLRKNRINYTPQIFMANLSEQECVLIKGFLKELTGIVFEVEVKPINYWFDGKIKSKIVEYAI